MKGVIRTQLIEMVEDKYGFDTCDEMINDSGVDGIYTQAGNYPSNDMFAMIKALSTLVDISIEDLIFTYGEHLFSVLIKIYPKSISSYNNSFEFISNVEEVIHPEVKKLYPDSDLPSFEMISINNNEMKIIYKSSKPLMGLAKGLMTGCIKYYEENIDISYDKPRYDNNMYQSLFTLTKNI